MVDFIVSNFDVLLGFIAGAFAYAYKKGKKDTTEENNDRRAKVDTKALKHHVEEIYEAHNELRKVVNRIEEALDRSYATTKYVHDTFPSREVFDIKMESAQEHITSKIEGLMQMLKIQRDSN